MNYIQTEIDGVWIIEPKVFNDARGYFMEAFKEEEFRANIGDVHFVQDNESKSSFGVLRGLHYQKGDKVDNGYAPQAEASIRFNDETIGIDWPVAESQFILSEKDGHAVSFKDAEYFE